jgi:hypothetical protein
MEGYTPTPKVATGFTVGTLTTIIIYIATESGLKLGPTEAGAIATGLFAAAAWKKRDY